ncbi:MAG: acyltransferase family protein, partial [Firmicutes bacterium]|nr:acyltransferase family protein [Candidatus Caballimonas caccae]
MIFFITFLRFLAACLITNSHYTGVYPTDIIANGGLLGDVLFFAVSGYCLANVKKSFPSWYWKRLVRCYLPVLIISGVYLLIGFYSLNENSALWWLLYPTNYHFVSSI